MKEINNISDKINTAVQYVGFVQLSIMTFIIILQVFYRYVLDSSLSWSEECARYLFIWIVMLGASMGVKEGFHVAVTIFKDRLPTKAKRGVEILFTMIIGLMATAMVVYGWSLSQTVAIQLSPAIRISMFWVYLSIPVSGLLIIIHLVAKVIDMLLRFNSIDEGGR